MFVINEITIVRILRPRKIRYKNGGYIRKVTFN